MPKTIDTTLHGDKAVTYMAIIARVDALLQCSENFVLPSLNPASPASPMDRARKSHLWDAYEQAWRLLTSAEDHLTTILQIMNNNVLPTFALYSLLRPAANAAARMAYLLDRAITEQDRFARGLNIRFENLLEQNKVKPDAGFLKTRVKHLEDRASANGIEVIRSMDATPKITGFGERKWTEIGLVQGYIDEGEMLYRLLSAHVHCQPWVVMIGRDRAVASDELGFSWLPTDVDTSLLGNVLTLVLGRHERNLIDLVELAGYPRAVWNEAMTTATARAKEAVISRATVS